MRWQVRRAAASAALQHLDGDSDDPVLESDHYSDDGISHIVHDRAANSGGQGGPPGPLGRAIS